MAINIAAQQQLAQPASAFFEGQAMQRVEQDNAQRMRALENAEGRAAAGEKRAQETHDIDKRAAEAKFDEINGKKALAGAQQVLALPKGQRKKFVENNFPELVQKLSEQEYGWDEVDEDEIEEMATGIAARASADLGISPSKPEEYSLKPGEKRMRGSEVIAENEKPEEKSFTRFTRYQDKGMAQDYILDTKSGEEKPLGQAYQSKGPEADKEMFARADKLRDEFNNQSKEFITVANSYQRIRDSASDPSAAGDLSLIFNYMKVLDPGSTVREGEFATAQSAGSVPARIIAQYNKVMSGERLSTEQREDFVNRADKLYKGQETRHEETVKDRYEGLAKDVGVDPRRVVSDFNVKTEKVPTGAPKITSDAEYDALPSGTVFLAPDGKQRRKP